MFYRNPLRSPHSKFQLNLSASELYRTTEFCRDVEILSLVKSTNLGPADRQQELKQDKAALQPSLDETNQKVKWKPLFKEWQEHLNTLNEKNFYQLNLYSGLQSLGSKEEWTLNLEFLKSPGSSTNR